MAKASIFKWFALHAGHKGLVSGWPFQAEILNFQQKYYNFEYPELFYP